MKEKVSLTTMTVTYPLDDDDLPFESADDYFPTLHVEWDVVDPEYGRELEPNRWDSHDWTMDYDYPDDYAPEHDEEFE